MSARPTEPVSSEGVVAAGAHLMADLSPQHRYRGSRVAMKFSGRLKSRLEANVGMGGCVSAI